MYLSFIISPTQEETPIRKTAVGENERILAAEDVEPAIKERSARLRKAITARYMGSDIYSGYEPFE
jgi:hypothetical protein